MRAFAIRPDLNKKLVAVRACVIILRSLAHLFYWFTPHIQRATNVSLQKLQNQIFGIRKAVIIYLNSDVRG